jgi:hypothetical protein
MEVHMSEFLTLTMQPQIQPNWCWAAVASSVSDFLRDRNSAGAFSQCQIACKILGQTTCCDDGGSDACNQDSALDPALEVIGHLNGDPIGGPISFDSIMTQTSPPYSVPIGVRVSNGAQGHFLLIVGFNNDDGNQWVYVADPCYGPATYDLNDFTNGYQGMPWTDTYPIK